jgi:predicted GH43/DUF377 family glycosyl hydrolase
MVHINLVKTIINDGGTIKPIYIDNKDSGGTGLCNASILYSEGKLRMVLRNVEYTLHCCEGEQLYQSCFEGPLSYYCKDKDIKIRTTNFYCELNPETLEIQKYHKIDSSKLDVTPIWSFIGLEDARLVYWNNKYYAVGVRRDTTINGQGRMEFSELEITENSVKEINRNRIEVPSISSYCEKNWMPIKNKPFHFIKWSNPTEVVKVNLDQNKAEQTFLAKTYLPMPYDIRGGSQLIEWDDDTYLGIVHGCKFTLRNYNGYKDADYFHRFIIWNKDWSIKYISDDFNFLDTKIEFCIGLEQIEDDIFIVFGYQDNGCYALKLKKDSLNNIIWNKLKNSLNV